MSAYLMRLTTRGRPTGGADALQPFVRSRSPIADRDQRIGIAGLEGVGVNTLSSLDEARTEPMPPKRAMSEPAPQAGITADRGGGEETLRRKPNSPVSMAPGLSVPTAVTHSTPGEVRHSTPRRPSNSGIGNRLDTPMREPVASPERKVAATPAPTSGPTPTGSGDFRSRPPPSVKEGAGSPVEEVRHSTPLRPSNSGIGDRIDTPVRVTRASVVSPERDVAPNLEPFPTVSDDFRSQPPPPVKDGARSPLENPVAVRRRSVRDTPEVDTAPRLEPSPRIFPDPIETSVAAAGMARADADPREVIDQGNVDGVLPPVSTETKAPSRSGPLTAASVSVIGPLGGNLASRMAFGLRYR